jgi:fumarate reductase subunit D
MDYPRALAFAQHWLGKGFLIIVISLFAWHAVHRIFHSLHDLGIPTGTTAKLVCYGSALAITIMTGASLFSLGW